jgi:ankyrin repeat protein
VCKKSIKRWADVNLRIKTRGYKGFTLLMWVSRKGNLKLVKLFIKAGANIKLKTPQNKIKYAYTI